MIIFKLLDSPKVREWLLYGLLNNSVIRDCSRLVCCVATHVGESVFPG